MVLVLLIDAFVVATLCYLAFTKSFEDALPTAVFLLMLFPFESTVRFGRTL